MTKIGRSLAGTQNLEVTVEIKMLQKSNERVFEEVRPSRGEFEQTTSDQDPTSTLESSQEIKKISVLVHHHPRSFEETTGRGRNEK